jgi:peptidoglycan/xylan/chitin deacetylase (PgdA/CDA1 family)
MLCITFDNFGCGADYGFGQGKLPPCKFPELVPPSEWESYNDIGLTLGQPRILSVLKQLEIKTTFFAEGYSAILHPIEMKRWSDAGHEIALHGWKHEMWANLISQEQEERLVSLSVAAMTELLGQGPVGIRPPGFKINPWTDEVLQKNGIRYVSTVAEREAGFADRLAKIGVTYANDSQEVVTSRLKILPCQDDLTDAGAIGPAYGGLGLYGYEVTAEAAYEKFYLSAVAHEESKPNEPWVFTAHPFVSGNRAWGAFDRFLRRLRERFPIDSFHTGRQIALGIAESA